MPYLETAQSWLTQSTLLLQARPSTTRITTKYTILKPSKSKPTTTPASTDPSTQTSKPDPPRALLSLKTYDPQSGSTLKYKTTKAAEVSRLIQILGRLARPMAGLPPLAETTGGEGDTAMASGGPGTPAVEAPTVALAAAGKSTGAQGGAQGGGGSAGKKSKKKGGKK